MIHDAFIVPETLKVDFHCLPAATLCPKNNQNDFYFLAGSITIGTNNRSTETTTNPNKNNVQQLAIGLKMREAFA